MHNCAHSEIEFDDDGHGRIVVYANEDYREKDAGGVKITDAPSSSR